MFPLVTDRLILRGWREEDRAPFAAINADPEVMRYFPRLLSREVSDELVDRFSSALAAGSVSFAAVEERATQRFIGFIGLRPVNPDLPIAPATEIGWRLAAEVWGRGYATEGAQAALSAGFARLALDEVVAYTPGDNSASRRVMEIGLRRDAGRDFNHPGLPDGHLLRWHVVYRINRSDWLRSAASGRA